MKLKGGIIINLNEKPQTNGKIDIRQPNMQDGKNIWDLVNKTDVLDLNSSYSYIMWCDKFADSSIVAYKNDELVGFIKGFVHESQGKQVLFIWQIAVVESVRGEGLGTKMIQAVLEHTKVEYLEATVTPSNTASNNLFKGIAEKFNATYQLNEYIKSDDFPSVEDEEEEKLYHIGPIKILKKEYITRTH